MENREAVEQRASRRVEARGGGEAGGPGSPVGRVTQVHVRFAANARIWPPKTGHITSAVCASTWLTRWWWSPCHVLPRVSVRTQGPGRVLSEL